MTIPFSTRRTQQRARRTLRPAMRRRFELETLEARRVLATLIAGQVVDDLNANGAIDVGEPGQAQVTVYVDYNGNGQLDLVGDFVEPDDYDDEEVIDAADKGISFSVVDEDGVALPEAVVAHVDDWDGQNYASSGDLVFARKSSFVTESIFYDDARLRIDFDPPVTSVQLDYTGARLADVGVMYAYTEDGTLVDSYQTKLLPAHVTETMEVVSGEANIAYVFAHDKQPAPNGRLDALRINAIDAEAWTLTDRDGNYSLFVDDGATYRVMQVVPDGFVQSLPTGGEGYDVAIDVGQTVNGIDFANVSTQGRWQNPLNPLDVDNDTFITPTDVILIVNELNLSTYSNPVTGLLEPPPANVPAFFDYDDDGFVTPTDVINVVNALNASSVNAIAAEGEPGDVSSGDVGAALTSAEASPAIDHCVAADQKQTNPPQSVAVPATIDLQSVDSVFSEPESLRLTTVAVADDDDADDESLTA